MRSRAEWPATTTTTPALLGLHLWLVLLVGCVRCARKEPFPPAPDPDTCRTVRSREILVCDPEEIFTDEQISDLERKILRIRNETVSPCNATDNARGFTLRLALVKRYNQSFLPVSNHHAHLKYADKMHAYADYLHNQWAAERGDCDDGVLIFISKENKAVLTVVGKEVNHMLPLEFRINLCKQMAARMSRGGNVMSAVRFGLSAVGDALRHGPSHGIESSAQHRRATLTIVGVMAAVTIAFAGITWLMLRWKKRRRRRGHHTGSVGSVAYASTDDEEEEEVEDVIGGGYGDTDRDTGEEVATTAAAAATVTVTNKVDRKCN